MLNDTRKSFREPGTTDYSCLRAIILNCTLKPTGQASQSDLMLRKSRTRLETNGVSVELLRPVDFDVAPGLCPDMSNHGYDVDEWPRLSKLVYDADILIVGTPLHLGEESSVCRRVLERLSAEPGLHNGRETHPFNGRAAGCLISGNEDGKIHSTMRILYTLQQVGFTIPPGSGLHLMENPTRMQEDPDSGHREDEEPKITAMIWNLLYTARMLKNAAGNPFTVINRNMG